MLSGTFVNFLCGFDSRQFIGTRPSSLTDRKSVMKTSICNQLLDTGCFDSDRALKLKLVAVAVVLLTGSIGVALPLLGRELRFIRLGGNFFAVTKAFAAGVILSTGFVHILPDAQEALTNPCLPEWPWSQFPFAEFVAMFAALLTLLTEMLSTEYYESQHSHSHGNIDYYEKVTQPAPIVNSCTPYQPLLRDTPKTLVLGHPVHQISAHDLSGRGHEAITPLCNGRVDEEGIHTVDISHHDLATHENDPAVEPLDSHIRNIVISQVLEVAVIAHSFIIGFSLGVSENPCAIKPLLAALSFHQFFEGFALGGCFSQAGFEGFSAFLRAGAFAITTPLGILMGLLVSSSYRANTPTALIVEGLFDAASAGILIYMALVDLIAEDFLSDRRRRTNLNLKCMSFFALFGGMMIMSAIAIWL